VTRVEHATSAVLETREKRVIVGLTVFLDPKVNEVCLACLDRLDFLGTTVFPAAQAAPDPQACPAHLGRMVTPE